MEEDHLIDYDNQAIQKKTLYPFQKLEFVLVGCFSSLLLLKSYFDFSEFELLITFFWLGILIFQGTRIYFEFKEQLITGFGIVLKIVLLLVASTFYMGTQFVVLQWPDGFQMMIAALLLLAGIYPIYAIVLNKIQAKTKILLLINALCSGVFLFGILFKLESWPGGMEMTIIGTIAMIISMLALMLIQRKEITNKGQYHSINYFARSLLLLTIGLFYLFLTDNLMF